MRHEKIAGINISPTVVTLVLSIWATAIVGATLASSSGAWMISVYADAARTIPGLSWIQQHASANDPILRDANLLEVAQFIHAFRLVALTVCAPLAIIPGIAMAWGTRPNLEEPGNWYVPIIASLILIGFGWHILFSDNVLQLEYREFYEPPRLTTYSRQFLGSFEFLEYFALAVALVAVLLPLMFAQFVYLICNFVADLRMR